MANYLDYFYLVIVELTIEAVAHILNLLPQGNVVFV